MMMILDVNMYLLDYSLIILIKNYTVQQYTLYTCVYNIKHYIMKQEEKKRRGKLLIIMSQGFLFLCL